MERIVLFVNCTVVTNMKEKMVHRSKNMMGGILLMVYSVFPVFFSLFPNMTVDTGHGGGGETHNMTPAPKVREDYKGKRACKPSDLVTSMLS